MMYPLQVRRSRVCLGSSRSVGMLECLHAVPGSSRLCCCWSGATLLQIIGMGRHEALDFCCRMNALWLAACCCQVRWLDDHCCVVAAPVLACVKYFHPLLMPITPAVLRAGLLPLPPILMLSQAVSLAQMLCFSALQLIPRPSKCANR